MGAGVLIVMSGKKDKASAEDLHVMDTVEQYETYEDYLDSQVSKAFFWSFGTNTDLWVHGQMNVL